MTGHTGPLSIGVLNIQTKKEGGVPGDNSVVARTRADVLSSGGLFPGDRTSLNRAVGFRFSKHLKARRPFQHS